MFLYSETLYTLYNFSGIFPAFLLLLLCVWSLINFKYFVSLYKVFLILILGYTFFEVVNFILELMKISNTTFWNFPYNAFSIFMTSLFYYKIFKNPFVNRLIIIGLSIYIIGLIYQIITAGMLESPWVAPIKNVMVSILAIMLNVKLLKSKKLFNLKSHPIFFINLGFLIFNLYYLIMDFIFNKAIPISDDLAFIFGILRNLADPIAYTLWAIGIYKLKSYNFKSDASLSLSK